MVGVARRRLPRRLDRPSQLCSAHGRPPETEPCPGFLDLDVKTLLAVLGGDFKLERLRTRCSCWQCNTKHVALQWIVPDDPVPPGGTAEQTATVLRLRPGRLRLAQDRFRSVEGGKR